MTVTRLLNSAISCMEGVIAGSNGALNTHLRERPSELNKVYHAVWKYAEYCGALQHGHLKPSEHSKIAALGQEPTTLDKKMALTPGHMEAVIYAGMLAYGMYREEQRRYPNGVIWTPQQPNAAMIGMRIFRHLEQPHTQEEYYKMARRALVQCGGDYLAEHAKMAPQITPTSRHAIDDMTEEILDQFINGCAVHVIKPTVPKLRGKQRRNSETNGRTDGYKNDNNQTEKKPMYQQNSTIEDILGTIKKVYGKGRA